MNDYFPSAVDQVVSSIDHVSDSPMDFFKGSGVMYAF